MQAKGAVLIEGPKWCGKTTTAEEIAASKILLARTDVKNNFKSLLEIDTDAALSGDTPMLIDEWQTVPKLWDAVRYTVDHRRKMGQFILTGSAVPDKEAEEEREHSGTGRFAWLTMRPMTLFESGESNGKVSLGNLFTTPEKILEKNELKLQDIAFDLSWWLAYGYWITRRSCTGASIRLLRCSNQGRYNQSRWCQKSFGTSATLDESICPTSRDTSINRNIKRGFEK